MTIIDGKLVMGCSLDQSTKTQVKSLCYQFSFSVRDMLALVFSNLTCDTMNIYTFFLKRYQWQQRQAGSKVFN